MAGQDGGQDEQLRYGPMTNDAGTVPLTYDFSFVHDLKPIPTQVFSTRKSGFFTGHRFETFTLHRLCASMEICYTNFDLRIREKRENV